MKARTRQSGLTLIEQTAVVACIAVLVVLGLPAVRTFVKSFESQGSTRAMISGALACARAIAAKEQHYAGIRFQQAYLLKGPIFEDPLKAPQYMIFIIQDTEIGPGEPGSLGCRAVEGIEPIKLPDTVGVMDLMLREDEEIDSDNEIDSGYKLIDTTMFTILFSPSGKLVIHNLWVRNRDGEPGDNSEDDIFNTATNVENGTAKFLQDSDVIPSRNKFVIYDRSIFEKLDENKRWSDYLEHLDVIYINPYMGTMIDK